MPALPLASASFERTEANRVKLVNRYFEKSPVNMEDQVSLIPRPRIKQFAVVGAVLTNTPMTGLYRKGGVLAAVGLSGSIIARVGTQVFRVTQAGLPGVGTATLIGSLPGPQRMSAEGDPDRVVMCAGAAPYTTNGTTLTILAMPPGFLAYAVDYSAGRYIIASDNGRFYWTDPGLTTVNALDFATAEQQPDVLISLKVVGDELWLFGRVSIEVWQPTGNVDLPYQLIVGRVFGIGLTARDTCQKLIVGGLDTIAWVGTDRVVYRTSPNPERISEHWLEEILRNLADPTALHATCDQWDGHIFYTLTAEGVGSWTYDFGTGQWHDRTSFGLANFRANVWATGPNQQPLLGDEELNVLWELTAEERTDDGDPVMFECTGTLEVATAAARCDSVSMDVSTGLNPDPDADPVMLLDMSDDMGLEFGLPMAAPLGRTGDHANVVWWRRLGLMRRPGRIFRFRTTEPCTVRKAKYNEVSG